MKTGTFSLVWRYFLNNMNILLLTFQNKFVFGLIGHRPHVSSLLWIPQDKGCFLFVICGLIKNTSKY